MARTFLLILFFGLLICLFVDSFFQIEIAVTKNNQLYSFKKAEVDQMQNIDTVKVVAKSNFDYIRSNITAISNRAKIRLGVIVLLGLIAIIFVFKMKTNFRKGTND